MTDSITIFQSYGARMTKLIRPGKPIVGYEDARLFTAAEIPVASLDALRDLLISLAPRPTRFVVRGSLIGGTSAKNIPRRVHPNKETGEAPTLRSVARSWLALDMDEVPLPVGADVRDLGMCARAAVALLYPEFHGVRCIAQATSSHGLRPGARLRLWYWLSRPVGDREAKAWLADLPVDASVFGSSQPIFTASPLFSDGATEHLPRRLIDLSGAPVVQVPAEINLSGTTHAVMAAEPQASIEDIRAALATMTNDDSTDWTKWNEIGMATWRASGGDQDGLNAWLSWSSKSSKHDPFACEARWEHYSESPPTAIGYGTLNFLARKADPSWHQPSRPRVAAEDDFDAEDPPEPEPGEDVEDYDPVPWLAKMQRDGKGNIKPLLTNAMTAFEHAPDWKSAIRFNAFSQQITMTRQPPFPLGEGEKTPCDMKDHHIITSTRWLQDHVADIQKGTAADALVAVARQKTFHPVRQYLRDLVWDGTPRIDSWLVDYLGAAGTALNKAFSAKFLIAAVARVMDPGCKVDTMLVLEGEQGMRKSSALEILAGEWFIDHMPDLNSKDALQQMHGIWIAEHAEFDQIAKSDTARVKAFISTRKDKFRPPYGRVAEEFPRQCVFAATINPSSAGYLKDETGARRFWPVRCGNAWTPGHKVDIAALTAARNQMWAEACERYFAGEKWWLEDELEAVAAAETAKRYDSDVWTDDIAVYVSDKSFVTISEVLGSALRIEKRERDRGKQIRVGRVLRALNWQDTSARVNGKVTSGFRPPRRDETRDDMQDGEGREGGVVIQMFPERVLRAQADFPMDDDDLAEMMG